MKNYYVNTNAQSNGDNEVHEEGCYWLSLVTNRRHLGQYYTCAPAVLQAKLMGYRANGCAFCSKDCHTT